MKVRLGPNVNVIGFSGERRENIIDLQNFFFELRRSEEFTFLVQFTDLKLVILLGMRHDITVSYSANAHSLTSLHSIAQT